MAPLESHAEFTRAGSRDPVGLLLGQAKSRVPELVPVRHGRMLVSPFTFYRGAALPMAADLAGTPASGLRVQLCGDAHLSNFGAFASPERRAGLRRQRLRRDPARPVRVGRQAAGREPGRGRTGQRVPRQGPPQDRPGGGRGLPHRDARVRGADLPGRLVRAPGHRAGHRRVPVPGQGEKVQGSREAAGQGAHRRQHEGAGQADHRGRRAAADHQRPADDRPGRGGLRRRAGRRDLPAAAHRAGQVPAHPAVRPAAPARAVHAGPGGPQGRRGRQRRHPRLGPADGRRRRRRAAVPAGQGGPAVGPGGVLPGAASTPTRASGSSPGST